MLFVEFDYEFKSVPSLLFVNMMKLWYDMYLFKCYVLFVFYWCGMFKGCG